MTLPLDTRLDAARRPLAAVVPQATAVHDALPTSTGSQVPLPA
jgi:hypothetical protein